MKAPCDVPRAFLRAALCHSRLPAIPSQQQELLALAQREGVLALLAYQLVRHPEQPAQPWGLLNAIHSASKCQLAAQLPFMAEQKKICRILIAENIPFLMLKGGALRYWLYPEAHLRMVTDIDILLSSQSDLERCAVALAAYGYVCPVPAGDLVSAEHPLLKPGGAYGAVTVDVHWQLFNSSLLKDRFSFAELEAASIELPGQDGARGLGAVHALCHACGHRALNLPYRYAQGVQNANGLRWLWDIHALATRLNETQWLELLHLAKQKQISLLLYEGLRTAQSEFASTFPELCMQALQQQSRHEPLRLAWFTSWRCYQFRSFLAVSPHWWVRWRWLMQRIWPHPAGMRERYAKGQEAPWQFMLRRLTIGFRRMGK